VNRVVHELLREDGVSRPANILVLAPHAYYIDRGTPIDVDILLRALSMRGDRVDALVYHQGEDRDYPGVTIHRIRPPRFIGEVGPGFSLKKLYCDALLLERAWSLVRRNHYDVIHAGEEAVFFALLFKKLYGIPYVYDLDSSIAQQMVEKMAFLKPLAGLFNWCESRALRSCIAAAPVCHALADVARRGGAPRLVTLHDISQLRDEDFESSGEIRQRLGLDGTVVMYVGNLEVYQGIDLLIESFARTRERDGRLDLVVAGGRPDRIRKYEARAEELGIGPRTHFIGPWPVKRLGALLAEADILAVPRIRGVNTPMKVFPFLHSGRPLIATDLPTHTQILEDSFAMLAPADPEGFARALEKLAGDPALRKRLGEAGREFAEREHTFPAHVRRVNELYDQVSQALASPEAAASRTGPTAVGVTG
jgi:glycosyltransferase involved in cell wall biosynthesis